MSRKRYNVLFLCTGNSARSILAEAVLNRLGGDKFRGVSAGSSPKGAVHPVALELLAQHGYSAAGLRSKSWSEFATLGAEPLDVVITVCDNAAGEACPVWPGAPITAHWGLPDPAAVERSIAEQRAAFAATLRALNERLVALVALPIESLDRLAVQERVRALGRRDV